MKPTKIRPGMRLIVRGLPCEVSCVRLDGPWGEVADLLFSDGDHLTLTTSWLMRTATRAFGFDAGSFDGCGFADAFDARHDWSVTTFGPGDRTEAVVRHIRKELDEVLACPDDLEEWVDVAILAMTGAARACGADGVAFLEALAAKDAKNRARTWPDWRTVPAGQPVEHVRGGK